MFGLYANGVTAYANVELFIIEFSHRIKPAARLQINDPNNLKLKNKIPTSREKLTELVKVCIDTKKMSFVDTILYLGVSPSTIRRVCRTLKIGNY